MRPAEEQLASQDMDVSVAGHHRVLLGLAALLPVAICVALAWPIATGLVYTIDDLGWQNLPFRAFYARCLAAGDSPWWCPDLYCGFYLHAEGQTGMAHPLHWLLYRCFSLQTAYGLELLASYPFAFAGFALLLRRWSLAPLVCLFGATVFAFSGFNLLHFMHLNAIAIVAHIPWLLWALDVLVRGRARQKAYGVLGVALLTGSQLLLGYPEYVWYSVLAEISYLCVITRGAWARIPTWGVAKLVGTSIGAMQLWPTLDGLQNAINSTVGAAERLALSLHPANLVQLWAPYAYTDRVYGDNTHLFGLYPGSATVVLAFFVVCCTRWPKFWRSLAWWGLALAVLSLWLALGSYAGLQPLLSKLPVVGLFRASSRYIVLVHVGLAALATLGMAQLVRGAPTRRLGLLWCLPLASLGTALVWPVVCGWLLGEAGPQFATAPWQLLNVALLGAAAVLIVLVARGQSWALAPLLIFAALDQAAYGLSYIHKEPPRSLQSYVQEQLLPPELSPGRALFPTNGLILRGQRLASGYAGLIPAKRLHVGAPQQLDLAVLRVAQVEWVRLAQGLHPKLDALVRAGQRWLRVPGPLPRARLVTRAQISADPLADIRGLDVASVALVDRPLALGKGAAGQVTMLEDRPGYLKVAIDCSTTQLLVLSESFDAGWRAHGGQSELEVIRVYGDFMGCVVPAQIREVVFVFDPNSLRYGGVVSLLGLVVALN